MDKELKKLTIDAEKFAYTVVSSHHVENEMPEDIAKKQLTLYLTAYWLAERFNKLEAQSFENMERSGYEEFIGSPF
ncbi:hypothetical protein COJ85_24605 [Bacillus sp. AFS076308]|uniref:hypothetical protein n=1 Tax=unclassified Bacillus (in: firmicutes) TaxID=185979 RepID=UPI000BF5EA18|nr:MULTISPECIES: hypothetical protein [unclassified Bacillus (in: firmicutes)]PFN96372.1 hypothetical protein COJ85_24605 [Bacillus sp. AFS076308]PGV46542.1 hypothetical protein COD92_30030 [Bacillus sp. AFS037270]